MVKLIEFENAGKLKSKGSIFFCTLAIFLTGLFHINTCLMAQPSPSLFYGKRNSAPEPMPNETPVLKNYVSGISTINGVGDNGIIIRQNEEKAIINWNSFNIGENASTHFDQQGNPDWAVLNRIYDLNPSQIFGKLTADGRVFMINQNGILFGPNSRINTHSFTVSALNLENDVFNNDGLKYRFEDYMASGTLDEDSVYIVNQGNITVNHGGAVILLAPNIENSGTLSAPAGQVAMIAGTDVELKIPQSIDKNSLRAAKIVAVNKYSGDVTNQSGGRLEAYSGITGMYGRVVNQEGVVRSVSAVKREGGIEFIARDEIVLGEGSITECPVSDSEETVDKSFNVTQGWVTMQVLPDETDTIDEKTPDRIVLEKNSKIIAPHGDVTLSADDRIYLDTGSTIDVSGEWVDETSDYNVVSAKLNSVELRDDFGQKDNPALKGEEITFIAQEGSDIGNVEGALNTVELSAAEGNREGGSIQLKAMHGDIIIRDGSNVDISGGGYHFSGGLVDTTYLLCGEKIYNISDAPEWLHYDMILGDYKKIYKGFGVIETYEGLYYGGPAPMKNYLPAFSQGEDAGSFELIARNIIMDGNIDGSVFAGPYQNYLIDEPVDELGFYVAKGRVVPVSGKLVVGVQDTKDPEDRNYVTDEIVIKNGVEKLPEDFNIDSVPEIYPENPDEMFTTYLSSEAINGMNLSNLQFYANSKFTIEEGAQIELNPNGDFISQSRSIEHNGNILIPSGTVVMKTYANHTSDETNDTGIPDIEERLFLNSGSIIDVSGEKIDNSFLDISSGKTVLFGSTDGGTVIIKDTNGDGVVFLKDAVIDVSGGYSIGIDNKVDGGNGGMVDLSGLTVILDGDMRGHSVFGNNGGIFQIHTKEIQMVPWRADLPIGFGFDSEIPDGFVEKFYLASDQLKNSGFADIRLLSENNITFNQEMILQPSYIKIEPPLPGEGSIEYSGIYQNNWKFDPFSPGSYIEALPEYAGETSIALQAGLPVDKDNKVTDRTGFESVFIENNAHIKVAPSGNISVSAPALQIDGNLTAPSGKITVKSTGKLVDLVLGNTASIDTSGYNRMLGESTYEGFPAVVETVDAGTIHLSSIRNLEISPGAVLDVSGSKPVNVYTIDSEGVYKTVSLASEPGTISMSYEGYFNPLLNSESKITESGDLSEIQLVANKYLNDLPGGEFTVNSKINGFTFQQEDLDHLIQAGFDSVVLGSSDYIAFSDESFEMETPFSGASEQLRSLTLDAPEIKIIDVKKGALAEDKTDDIHLRATHLTITNTEKAKSAIPEYDSSTLPDTSERSICFTADYIDIEGNMVFSGFNRVDFFAENDFRLDWLGYEEGAVTMTGKLDVGDSDLGITAGRVYPMTAADFDIETLGNVLIDKSGSIPSGQILSAGGNISIKAENIDQKGTLIAPMGQIELSTQTDAGSVHFYNGSVTGTSFSDDTDESIFMVNYGEIRDGTWILSPNPDEPSTYTAVTDTPEKMVNIINDDSDVGDIDEIYLEEGAVIDVSGGGVIFAYEFLSGIDGTQNLFPLENGKHYVILPDNSVKVPGAALHLSEYHDYENDIHLEEGVYSILPESCAFLPDALIVTDLDVDVMNRNMILSEEGCPVVPGYSTYMGTGITSPNLYGYSVQKSVSEVKKEGYYQIMGQGRFEIQQFISADGGEAQFSANTTKLKGEISGNAVSEMYEGGSLKISGKNVIIGPNVDEITNLDGKLILDTNTFSGNTLASIDIGGYVQSTGENTEELIITSDSITFQADAELTSGSVRLYANSKIDLGGNAIVHGEEGAVAIVSPEGKVTTDSTVKIQAAGTVRVESKTIDMKGELVSENHSLELVTDKMVLGPNVSTDEMENLNNEVMYIDENLWGTFSSYDSLLLKSKTEIVFSEDVAFGINERGDSLIDELVIDTPMLSADNRGSDQKVDIYSQRFYLKNSSIAEGTAPLPVGDASTISSLTFQSGSIQVGNGNIAIGNFDSVQLNSDETIIFVGAGGLSVDGDLTFKSTLMTTDYYQDKDIDFQVSDFWIQAVNGHHIAMLPTDPLLTFDSSEYEAESEIGMGGRLFFDAGSIDHQGKIEVASSSISMAASGDIEFKGQGGIASSGTEYSPGGTILLESTEGEVTLGPETELNVSAGEQGDAGTIILHGASGGVTMGGTLLAKPYGDKKGTGGSLYLDTLQTDNMENIYTANKTNGFDHELNLRAREGNIEILNGVTITASQITFAADKGNIEVSGTIDASGNPGGGDIELYAAQNLTLKSGGHVLAAASGENADGGHVALNSMIGQLNFERGSLIDVSGDGSGANGTVTFRAGVDGASMQMNLSGDIKGASSIDAYAVQYYSELDKIKILSDLEALKTKLNPVHSFGDETFFHLRPAIEILFENDYSLDDDFNLGDLSGAFNNGELTIRSVGDLTINANLYHNSDPETSSWDINLIAGADLGSADFHSVMNLKNSGFPGDFLIASNKSVYTATGDIYFASASDTILVQPISHITTSAFSTGSPFNVGTLSGNITGLVNGNLILEGGTLQSATGNINLDAKENIFINRETGTSSSSYYGSIRTLGELPKGYTGDADSFWDFRNGGDIRIITGGKIGMSSGGVAMASSKTDGWDTIKVVSDRETGAEELFWSANYDDENTTQGIATLAGGDIYVKTAGDFLVQCGSFGSGDINIYSGGNVDGRFLIKEGYVSTISAMGSLGTTSPLDLPIELFFADLSVNARGNIEIGGVFNTAYIRKGRKKDEHKIWSLEYCTDSAISFNSETGDVLLTGVNSFIDSNVSGSSANILPPSVEIYAGKDIRFEENLYLAPSETGKLVLYAEGSIDGLNPVNEKRSEICMFDMNPEKILGTHISDELNAGTVSAVIRSDFSKSNHDIDSAYRAGDMELEIHADEDIKDIAMYLYSASNISAGRDIINLYYFGQNQQADDCTTIKAGRDIIMPVNPREFNTGSYADKGFEVGGPGELRILAGNSIDLGISKGIQSVANLYNINLDAAGCSTIVAAGFEKTDFSMDGIVEFFNTLKAEGKEYSSLLAGGELEDAENMVAKIQDELIDPFFDNEIPEIEDEENIPDFDESINMEDSQISTSGENSDLYIVALGNINVGRTTIPDPDASPKNNGIYTASGGAINMYAFGDTNVNESRVMSFRGGDISIWSDFGNINAGRGSKTAVNVEPPKVNISDTGEVTVTFNPPSVGSGVRTLTYDPDGIQGPQPEPDAGDVYLFAPKGEIDAGEAGIAGKNVFIAAKEILNAQNIEIIGGTGVGVPASGENISSLGSLSGEGGLNSTKEMVDQATDLTDAKDKMQDDSQSLSDSIKPKWLNVDFAGYETEIEQQEDGDRKNRNNE